MTKCPKLQYCSSTANTQNLPSTSCPSLQIYSESIKLQYHASVWTFTLSIFVLLYQPEEQRLERLFNLWPYASAQEHLPHVKKQMQRTSQRMTSLRFFYILCKSPWSWDKCYHHKAAPVSCWEKEHLPCCAAAEQTSAVRSQAKGAAVVGHFLISSSNPAVQGLFVNRKHHCLSLCVFYPT